MKKQIIQMKYKLLLLIIFIANVHQFCSAQQKLKVVLAGLSHDHVNPILDKQKAGQIEIIGIAEPDLQLSEKKRIISCRIQFFSKT